MGRGIALQLKQNYPKLPFRLGELILEHGNRPFRLALSIWTMPVKHHWAEKADLGLITASLIELTRMVGRFEPEGLMLPRPGCGNGQLDWDNVKPLVETFDTRTPCTVEVWDFRKEDS